MPEYRIYNESLEYKVSNKTGWCVKHCPIAHPFDDELRVCGYWCAQFELMTPNVVNNSCRVKLHCINHVILIQEVKDV